MGLYRSTPNSRPRFYDGGHYIIDVWDDALRIDTFDAGYLKSDPNLSQVHTPSIQLHWLGTALDASDVLVSLALRATPVLPKDPPLELRDVDRKSKELAIEFRLPFDVLPEMLMMNERQRARLAEVVRVHRNHAR